MASSNSDVPPYILDIRAQPATLDGAVRHPLPTDAVALLRHIEQFDRVVLTGMGSSLHGLYPTFLRLARAGLPVWHADTAELLGVHDGLLTRRSLLWITSQSGESAEVTELLDRLPRAAGPSILAVTNDGDSALAAAATAVLPLRSGDEHTVGTRSYLNTLALCAMAAGIAIGERTDELSAAPEQIAAYLDGWDDRLEEISEAVPDPPTFLLGRGASLASALTGALITKEAARRPLEGMSVPQFRHGPLEMASPSITTLLLAGSDDDRAANEQMRADLRHTGARCVWVDVAPTSEPFIAMPNLVAAITRPLAEIIPLQLLTVVLAVRDGAEPGRFRQISKVTRTL